MTTTLYKKDTAILKIQDEVNCVFLNIHPDHIQRLVDRYAIMSPTARFDPRYEFGQWDGKIKFFQMTGKTYNYLIPEIIPILHSYGYELELLDQRQAKLAVIPEIDKTFFSDCNDEYGDPIIMRPYQVDAVNIGTRTNGGIILAGTGAGKTFINGGLARLYLEADFTVVTIVPSTNLIRQTIAAFKLLKLDAGEYSGAVKDIGHPNLVSTWQALQNAHHVIDNYQVAIVDECHGAKATVLKELLCERGKNLPYRFGLTGTMPDNALDSLTVKVSLGSVKYQVPASELIKDGFLAVPNITMLQTQEDLRDEYDDFLIQEAKFPTSTKPPTYKQFKRSYITEFRDERTYLENDEERLSWIAGFLKVSQKEGKGNVFCIVPTIRMGKKLAKLCDAPFVYGKDDVEVREQIFSLFKENDNLLVFANAQIASVGIDIRRIFHLVYIDLGKSFIRVIQTVGRALRTDKDKDSVQITDIGSDLRYGAGHFNKRAKHYEQAEYPFTKKVITNYHVNF